MKVLVVNWRDMKNPEAGGAEVHIDEILKRKPSHWQVDFVSASFTGAPETEDYGHYRIIRIPNNALFNFTFRSAWKKRFSKEGYNLVIDDISKIPLATPTYIKNVPVISIIHHIHGNSLYQQLPFPMAFYVSTMERFLLRYYTKMPLVAVSESTAEELQRLYPFEKVSVQHNGIDFAQLNAAYEKNRLKKPVILTFGRLKKYKRVDHLIKALPLVLKEVPEAELWIAGKGDDEPRLKAITAELGLNDKVKFLGFIDEDKKLEVFRESALFAIASEKEGWGIVVIEANAGGLPAVGYRIPGLKDSIKDGVSGYLVENGNIEALSAKMIEVLKSDSMRQKLAEGAVGWASGFTWDNTARLFYKLVEDTTGLE